MNVIIEEKRCFSTLTFHDKADLIFIHPNPRYSWNEIVSGAPVYSESGKIRRIRAVSPNTFRGFYRKNKSCPGAQEGFINYFLVQRKTLVKELSAVQNRNDLHQLSNRICRELRKVLTNCNLDQLRSYNKIRKPVDLYIEHLVSMAKEFDMVRKKLIPLLFLPLDSQILGYPGLFTPQEIKSHKLPQKPTYKDIINENQYLSLQSLLTDKAKIISSQHNHSFHVIYFDLIWGHRYRNWGGNLFETIPDRQISKIRRKK